MTVRQDRLDEVVTAFHRIAEVHTAGGYAQIYQQMAADAATDPELLAIVPIATPGQNPPSLLLGSAQYLLAEHPDHPLVQFYPALTGLPASVNDPYPALRDFVLSHRDQITAIVTTRLVQTNEPA
ncbi:MAG TPA: DUF2332 family protein, partial [Pseudonocardiaceae bacterium]|nr:DUF2332 family protein [Pseudonocardiaceae bacterium]